MLEIEFISLRLSNVALPLPLMMVTDGQRTVVHLTTRQLERFPNLTNEQWASLRNGDVVDIYKLKPGEQIVVSVDGLVGVTSDRLPPLDKRSPKDSLTINFLCNTDNAPNFRVTPNDKNG